MRRGQCPNKNVFSDRLNREYDKSYVCRQTVPHSSGSSCKSPVSETAGCSVESQRPPVSGSQLSYASVDDRLTVIGKVFWDMTEQGR